jgi:hypothetical protein
LVDPLLVFLAVFQVKRIMRMQARLAEPP